MKLAYKISLGVGIAIVLLLMPARGRAEQVARFDGYLIHYNALSSDMLPAEVAQNYQLQRSSHNGLINIAVQKDNGDQAPTAVAATITGTAANLAGQRSPLTAREIREADAIYYLAEFPVRGTDTVRFDLAIRPDGSTRTHALTFSKNYVTD